MAPAEDQEMVTISKIRLDQLEEAYRKLNALESAGVDNWEWYDEAMSLMYEEDNNEEIE